ncbi:MULTISPECIES: DUF3598 family protein [unclassified Anabaena]|uniref:DUF3598 family protein n=1 Tax=unclassified Anabaena TaxID=2619674 RepID=UPI0039C74390
MNRQIMNLPLSDTNKEIKLENFKVLPKFVGAWEGHWTRLDKDANEIERFTSVLNQKIINNQWVQTNQNKYSSGRIENLSFFGRIVNSNTVILESPNVPYCNFLMLVEEVGENLIIINVSDKVTDVTLAIETINLISNNQRIRTLQKFHVQDGKLSGFIIVVEHKID